MSAVISCRDAVRRLWEYLDHGLSPDDHRLLEQHLAFCVQCCGELEFARALQQRLRSIELDVPAPVLDRLERFVGALGADEGGCDG